jgi:regulator of protease activity HflC (stomatin/prohibitin superfamily)
VSNNAKLLVGGGLIAAAATALIVVILLAMSVVNVPPGKFVVAIHKWGKDLPPEEIVAPDASYKGVMADPLQPGWHFLNPITWSYEEHPMVEVKPGQCLVLTRKYGPPIPPDRVAAGQILAGKDENGRDQRGIVAEFVTQGFHSINPYAYEYQIVDAVEIRTDQVGVRTLKVGKNVDVLLKRDEVEDVTDRYVVPAGFKGVQREPVRNGTHYINPFLETITPVEVQEHQVELTDIQFPSRDGFILKPHIRVVYQVIGEKAPELLIRLSKEGRVHQEDASPEQIKNNEILQKIILPLIRGYTRIEGSNFDARDFIGTEASGNEKVVNYREQFQKVLSDKVKPKCEEVGIRVKEVTLASLDVPKELTDQISARELARATIDKNKTLITQHKSDQTVKAAESLKQRAEEVNKAQIRRNKATVEAAQKLANEQLRLENDLASATLRLEAAKEQAKAILSQGEADAKIINLENEAQVAGLRQAMLGFSSVQVFAQYHVLSRIAPALTEIFASDESDFAKLFSTHLAQPPSNGTKSSSGSAGP